MFSSKFDQKRTKFCQAYFRLTDSPAHPPIVFRPKLTVQKDRPQKPNLRSGRAELTWKVKEINQVIAKTNNKHF